MFAAARASAHAPRAAAGCARRRGERICAWSGLRRARTALSDVAIALDHVSVVHPGGRRAVDDVSLTIERGAFVALIGASGSGKTSLLKTINRLSEPSSGVVRIDGRDARTFEPSALRRAIGYVFQGVGLFPHMSVAENIALVPRLEGWPRARIDARVTELIALMDLPADAGARAPSALSGGQRQRVGVARALAASPKIVLMDEPFGALDPLTRDALGDAYRALHDSLGLTTVMVTHDMQEAALLADRIVALQNGRVTADDAPAALLRGEGGESVGALLSLPRRQAERIQAMLRADGTEARAP